MVAMILTGILLALALQTGKVSLPQPSMPGRPVEGSSGDRPDAMAAPDGRMLVVRMYRDWENAPAEFKRLRVRFQGNRVAIEPNEAPVSPVAVIVAEDQEDRVVREMVGDYIWVQSLTKEFALQLPFRHGPEREVRFWMFTDALNEPLGNAAAEIWVTGPRGHPRIRLDRTTLDDAGGLTWKRLVGNLGVLCFIVSHPEYGCAEVREPFESARRLTVPLVRQGTPAAERGIHGRIVDPNGVPVAGATIECRSVRTLGDGALAGLGEPGKGITDANGVFSFYLPNRQGRADPYDRFSFYVPTRQLIPPKSRYAVRIDAPKSLGLLPCAASIENGQEARIVLECGDRLRRLRFEDQNGEITDPAELEAITVCLPHDGNVLRFYYDDWKNGVLLPPGTYHAIMRGSHGEYDFAPVELTRRSPETVVFRLPAGVTYCGRVVHGITGRPMPGAFVLAMSGRCAERRLCDLTPEQWGILHGLSSAPLPEDTALDPLREVFTFTKLVRTDRTGSYRIHPEPDETFYSFCVFEQDYAGVMYRRDSLQANADHLAAVPTIKLFPAATVFVETMVDRKFLSSLPRWEIDEGPRPAWVEELLALDDDRGESLLEYKAWLKSNARLPIHVPAGISLHLKLDLSSDEEFCPILIPQAIHLRQGETADLGRFAFQPALAVQVRVVDSAGRAREGIPVRTVEIRADGTGWDVPHNTDEHGIARFHVVPNSTGLFGVLCHIGDGVPPLQEMVDYKVGGPEDAGREFVLQLSDTMLAHLLQ